MSLKNMLKKFYMALDRFIETSMILIFLLIILVVTSQITMRYIVGRSLFWADEVSRYGFIWITWFGASYIMSVNKESGVKHIAIDTIIKMFPRKIEKICIFINDFLAIAFLLVLSFYAVQLTVRTFSITSSSLGIPMGLMHSSALIGSILMILQIIRRYII